MGFLDKIKAVAKQIKEENRNMGTTTKRINNVSSYYGEVNRGVKNGDFWEGSYVSIEGDHGVIYGSNQDDYTFTGADVASFEVGVGVKMITRGNEKVGAISCTVSFKDGKKALMAIFADKIDAFKLTFSL